MLKWMALLCLLLCGCGGGSVTDSPPAPATVRARVGPSRTVQLRPGWNPVGLACSQVTSLESSAEVAGIAWLAGGAYATGAFTAEQINRDQGPRRGFWVFAHSATSFTYAGEETNSSLELSPGWNLVSLARGEDLPAGDLRVDGTTLEAALLPQFYELQPDASFVIVDVRGQALVRSGRAYWIYASRACTLRWPEAPSPSPGASATPTPTPRPSPTASPTPGPSPTASPTAGDTGEFQINTTTAGVPLIGRERSVARAAGGDFVAVWYSTDDQVYIRRYNAGGVPQGPEFAVTNSTQTMSDPSVAMGPDGGFVVTWSLYTSQEDIYARFYGPDGTPRTPQIRVNTYLPAAQSESQAAFDANGNVLIVWASSNQDGSGWGIYGRRLGPTGDFLGAEFRVSTPTQGNQFHPHIASNASGATVVAWSSPDGSGEGICALRFNSSGQVEGTELQVNTTTTDHQTTPRVAVDSQGRFVITWTSVGTIRAQRFGAAGDRVGTEFLIPRVADTQNWSSLAMTAQGDFVVAWTEGLTDQEVYARRYNPAGQAQGAAFKVNTTSEDHQRLPTVALDGSGNIVVTWVTRSDDRERSILFGRLFRADGTPFPRVL